MKRFVAAVASALRAVLSVLRGLVMLPFRLVGVLMGVPPDVGDIPSLAPLENMKAAEPPFNQQQVCDDIAATVLGWCADSLMGDRPAPLPPRLPIALREWLPGLSRQECEIVVNCEIVDISAHCRGFFAISGVRPLGPLPLLGGWPARPGAESGNEVTDYGEDAAPFRP